MNLGPRPTFGDGVDARSPLFDADGDSMAPVRVDLVSRLRETAGSTAPAALGAQMVRDEQMPGRCCRGGPERLEVVNACNIDRSLNTRRAGALELSQSAAQPLLHRLQNGQPEVSPFHDCRADCRVGLVAISATVDRALNRGNGDSYYDTLQRVPLKRGLDLQGGMYLSLEMDESKGRHQPERGDRSRAESRPQRIDEFGVSEPIVQKVGTDRIVVELPGIDDPARALGIVQNERVPAVPDHGQDAGARASRCARMDAIVKRRSGVAGGAGRARDKAQTPASSRSSLQSRPR